MRRWTALLALGTCGVLGTTVGCESTPEPSVAPESRVVMLEAGTPVDLVVLTSFESGSPVGDDVLFMVATDVVDPTGEVLVAQGALARAQITRSRKANLGSMVLNQPARLEIEFGHVVAIDGSAVRLAAAADDNVPTRSIARSDVDAPTDRRFEQVWADPEARASLQVLSEALEQRDLSRLASPEHQEALERVAERLDLASAGELLRQGGVGQANDTLRQMLSAEGLVGLATGDTARAVQAIGELAGVAGNVGRQLARQLDAPNIRVPIGSRFRAFVATPTPITVAPS